MHELSLIERILEIAAEETRLSGSTRIHRIVLRVGPLAGVVPDALLFAFDVASSQTLAEGATLEVETLPLRAICVDCGLEFQALDLRSGCPGCGSQNSRIEGGRELELAGLEVS